MRWDELPRSDNVEDRRADGPRGMPMGRTGGIGIGTLIVLCLIGWALGINCPNDRKVYLDTSFFQDLERRFRGCDVGSKGCQFSQAYVITHEIGHHVQNLLGILPKVQQMQRGVDQAEANQLQVRVELQADCLSGVWAHHAEEKWRLIEPGDVEAAMQTASAIGDDRLQRRSQGYVVPDAFTHGSSAQRTRWFLAGLKSGELASCDTFSAQQL